MKHPLTCYDSSKALFYYNYPETLISQNKKTNAIKRSIKKLGNVDKKILKNYQKLLDDSINKETEIKRNFREEVALDLCRNYKIIKIEKYELNGRSGRVNLKNREDSLLGKNCSLILKEIEKYCNEFGSKLIVIPKNKPTTQTCSSCGHRKRGKDKMQLDDKIFVCEKCGTVIPRDLNAAINIYNYNE